MFLFSLFHIYQILSYLTNGLNISSDEESLSNMSVSSQRNVKRKQAIVFDYLKGSSFINPVTMFL